MISKICCNFKVLIYKQLQTKIAMITEDKVTEIFCMADDFCKFFDVMVAKYTLKPTGKRKYHRDSTMSKAEVMLIMILFHDSGYHCFKHFYLEKRCRVSMYKGLLTHSLLCSKFVELTLNSRSLKTIFQHKACTDKLYAGSFYKVQKNSHSSFEVICCRS